MNFFKLSILVFSLGLAFSQDAAQQVSQEADSTGAFCLRNIDTWIIHSSIIGEDYTIYVLRTGTISPCCV